jgi:hypothetical protein
MKRESGYYWVKNKDGIWVIARWWQHLEYWDLMKTSAIPTSYFLEIDENQIIHKDDRQVSR